MSQVTLPVVRPLESSFSLERAFSRLAALPGCLWFDSALQGTGVEATGVDSKDASDSASMGRYSFLTADPIDTLTATIESNDPWSEVDRWCRHLPRETDATLPPFQGGIAGLWGYEAATWLESIPVAERNDLPTPAMSLGLYDWTLALDHARNTACLICQGFGGLGSRHSFSERVRQAERRADQVASYLAGEPSGLLSRLACQRVEPDKSLFASQHETSVDGVRSNQSSLQLRNAIRSIVASIRRGDSFQVNLAQRLLAEATCDAPELYLRLRRQNPAPFGAYYGGNGFQVLSSSPEGFLQVRDGRVQTRPIKGTIPRTGDVIADEKLAADLLASEKDRAENVMIVDLLRNDLSRVCTDESVHVTKLWGLERYQYVQHLVSVVEGELARGRTVADLLRACFPGGSVTGAPKIEAMKTIARLEPNPRGPYCGSIGYIRRWGQCGLQHLDSNDHGGRRLLAVSGWRRHHGAQ